jgi:glutathione S-transferase
MRAIGLGLSLYDASDAESAHVCDALVGAYVDSCRLVSQTNTQSNDKAQSNAVKVVLDILLPQLRKNPDVKFTSGNEITIGDICMAAFYFELVLHDCNRDIYSKLLQTE